MSASLQKRAAKLSERYKPKHPGYVMVFAGLESPKDAADKWQSQNTGDRRLPMVISWLMPGGADATGAMFITIGDDLA